MTDKQRAKKLYRHVKRMEIACLVAECRTSYKVWMSEPVEEQKRYYNWLCNQVGSFTAGPWWDSECLEG